MKVNKHIEKPSYIIGLPAQEFIVLVGYAFTLFFLNNILGSFGLLLGYWFYLFWVFTTWGMYLVLKWGARQNYPGFLISYFSFKVMQGKKIELKQYSILIKK